MKVRYILLILECVMLFFFVYPVSRNVFNAGNLAGMLACGVLLAVTIFWQGFSHLVCMIWSNGIGKIGLSLLALILAAGIAFCGIMTVQMIRACRNTTETPSVVITLGCRVKGDRPSLMLLRRLEATKTYLEQHPDTICIVCGGQGEGENLPEGDMMYQWLTENGIDAERILVDNTSEDTQENMQNAKSIMDEKNLGTEAVVITDGYHEYRASLLAKRAGITPYAHTAWTNPLFVPTFWVREWMGLFQFFVFGHG